MNEGKIILDLCGGTGAWSQPYKDAGYDVRVITLPQYDMFATGYTDHSVIFRGGSSDTMEIDFSAVYGILAAPTCTMFSLARTTAKEPRDFREGLDLVNACLKVVHEVRIHHRLAFWALENPMGYLRQFLGKPLLTFNPNDYGDPYTKKTDLWGYYNEPRKSPVPLSDQQMRDMSINNRALQPLPEGYELPKGFRSQAARRSITPKGFAKAFYKANK